MTWPQVCVTQVLHSNTDHVPVQGHTHLAEIVGLVFTSPLNMVVLTEILDLKPFTTVDMRLQKRTLIILPLTCSAKPKANEARRGQ